MKTFKYYATILMVVGVMLSSLAFGVDSTGPDERSLYKPQVLSALNFDGNRIDNDLMNNGMIVSHLVSGRSGLSWPAGNGTQTIYASGVWLGAKVSGQTRVVAGEFNGEFAGGPWGGDPTDPRHKLYKVSKSDLADPLANDDFQNWPTDLGAPFIDNNGNGTYEPLPSGPDMPDFIGDQVIWAVMNDGDPTTHSIFHSAPMGLEVQMTMFGFDRPDEFGDMLFIKELIINRGVETINEMIIGLWSDPDLGDAADDLVGCDTTLGMGIVYNSGTDVNFAGYSGGTPAAGYDFFQGPMVPAPGETAFMFGRDIPDMKNLSMTSFTKYINGDPVYEDPETAEQAYNYMSGFMPDGSDFPFIASGGTKFVHPGDPTKDTGPTDTEYVDEDLHPPDDRRFLMNAGPFTMVPGDSQEVVFGILHAAAGGPLDSYLYLKQVDALAQLAYDIQFALPPSPPNPVVEITTFEDEIILTWDSAAELYVAEDQVDKDPDGNNTEFIFEGYNVYQLGTASGSGDVKRLATYDHDNGLTEIFDNVFDPNFGESINRRVQFGSDSGLKRSISIKADAINNGSPLLTNRNYYFAVTAYGYNPYGIPRVLESPMQIMSIRPQVSTLWMSEEETAIYGTVVDAVHTAGVSDGVAYATVVDPTLLTGDEYEMFFTDEEYFLDIDGIWKNTNSAGKEALAKILDCTGSMITVAALASANVGTYDLTFSLDMHCGSNWVDGILLDFPDDVVINSWDPLASPSYAQDVSNIAGTFDAATNSILWGDQSRSGYGAIEGSQSWAVNIAPAGFPIDVAYTVIDDNYDGTTVDAVGTASATELGYDFVTIEGWYARNLNTGDIITPHTTIQSGVATDNVVSGVFVPAYDAGDNAGPIADGLQFAVDGPALGFKSVTEIAYAGTVHDAPDNVWHSLNSNATYFMSAGGGSGDFDRLERYIIEASPRDFEMRFTDGPNYGVSAFTTQNLLSVPFELWDTGIATPDDPSDDYRMMPFIYENVGATNAFDYGGDTDPYFGGAYVASDWVYWMDFQDQANGYDTFAANVVAAGGPGNSYSADRFGYGVNFYPSGFVYPIGRLIIGDFNLAGAGIPSGTTIRMITKKPNSSVDKFSVSTAGLGGSVQTYDSDGINVWPNPYFGFNPEERDPVDNQIHFTNLPATGQCTIRIFDLAGVPVRTIDHDNGTTLEIWNVKNDSNIPVASGMYIVVVETDDGDKILKIAIIQPEQRLDLYG